MGNFWSVLNDGEEAGWCASGTSESNSEDHSPDAELATCNEACELLRKSPAELSYLTTRDRQLILHALERRERATPDPILEKLEEMDQYLTQSDCAKENCGCVARRVSQDLSEVLQAMKAPRFASTSTAGGSVMSDVVVNSVYPERLESQMGCEAMQHFSAATRANTWTILRKLVEWSETGAFPAALAHVSALAGEDGIILSWVSSGIFCEVEDARVTVLQVEQGGSKYECNSKVYDVRDARMRDLLMDYLKAHIRIQEAGGDEAK